jgi:hypothetical protein
MIRWLASERYTFHQLTGFKFTLCASESSLLVKKKLSPKKLLFYQKLSVSLLYLLAYSQQPGLALVDLGVTSALLQFSNLPLKAFF